MCATPIVTDAALVAAVADGDASALRELYERHGAWLHARLIRRCNDPEVVVEVVQDTFVALWKDARRFRHDGEVGAWLWGLRRLSPEFRSVVQAVVLDGLTTKEAGRLLGVRENTVKTRLHRAKAQLRATFTEPQEGWR
jgi:RNA polymerase sigma-70 factor (ECF subfamily)